ncbi:hypothetical protein SAMD00023353_5500100 [Rosellinia necatrix]|uniref:Uncharacterized protein n=1 Tax=Rosellinia necatrix TaxID=77044 RepID=A0A1S8A9Y7_ROSNE|nr:hypothetical protein SAMD00023353_5500100 [Rosellinia necatrix]
MVRSWSCDYGGERVIAILFCLAPMAGSGGAAIAEGKPIPRWTHGIVKCDPRLFDRFDSHRSASSDGDHECPPRARVLALECPIRRGRGVVAVVYSLLIGPIEKRTGT